MTLDEQKVIYASKFTETILEARHFLRNKDTSINQHLEPLELELALYLLHGRLAKKAEFNKKLAFWDEADIAKRFKDYVGRSIQPSNSSICRTLATLQNLKLIKVVKEESMNDAFLDLKKIKISYLLTPKDVKRYHIRADRSLSKEKLKKSNISIIDCADSSNTVHTTKI